MRSNSIAAVFEVIAAIFIIGLFVFLIMGAIDAAKDGDDVSSRCIAAGYSSYRYSEGRVYCLDFGAEPRIMRLEPEE